MNQASFFVENIAIFGGYPNHSQITELINEGVVWFIDLTINNELNTKAYSHLVQNWINFPIKDGDVPENKKQFTIFLLLIQIVLESLKPGEKLYLHCRGGHGRSSLVISCFLGLTLKIPPTKAMRIVKDYHTLRPNLRNKWLSKWPLNLKQRKFVESFFGSIYFYSNFGEIQIINTKVDFFRCMVILNLYLHQNQIMLEVLLNSGLKIIYGEGLTSLLLQELRFYILYAKAKKIFECG